jgi:hypothetical protein
MPSIINQIRDFYNSVMQEWFEVEYAATQAGHYTHQQQAWLRQHRRKVAEATQIYQIVLLEAIRSESRVLKWLTVALIGATIALAIFSYIQYLELTSVVTGK